MSPLEERERLLETYGPAEVAERRVARALLTIPSKRRELRSQLFPREWLRIQVSSHIEWRHRRLHERTRKAR